MSNMIKKVKEITIGEEEFIITADMRTISTFKELTGESFLKSVHKLNDLDDELILNLAASTLRRKDTPKKVIGRELLDNYNPFTIIMCCSDEVTNLVIEGMPEAKGHNEKK